MDKKALLMVRTIVVILLSMIIFVPLIMGVTKYCQYSAQAKGNYGDFVKEINAMEEGTEDITKLILDIGSAVVYFEPGQKIVKVTVDGEIYNPALPNVDYEVIFNKPSSCGGESCLCLFGEKTEIDDKVVKSEGATCEKGIMNLKLKDCSIGRAVHVNSYSCENGFVIERLLIKKAAIPYDVYYEAQRRVPLQMKREGNIVYLES